MSAPDISTNGQKGVSPDTDFPKSDWPFYWITQTAHRYMMLMEKRLKALEMDLSSWRILMALGDDRRMSISELSDLCIIKPNTATKIVQRMLTEGLVLTGSRPEDARVTEVGLTETGQSKMARAREIAEEVYASAFTGLSHEEGLVLNMLLKRIFYQLT